MLLRKKPMFGANIQPACTYCEFGQKAADPRMILCAKKGVVSPGDSCRSFRYDPLIRVPTPPVALDLGKLKDEDFTL